MTINRDLISTTKEKGLFRKPMKIAADWHDEVYYGDTATDGITGTKNSAGGYGHFMLNKLQEI